MTIRTLAFCLSLFVLQRDSAKADVLLNTGDALLVSFTTLSIDLQSNPLPPQCGPCSVHYLQLMVGELGTNDSDTPLRWSAELFVDGLLLGTYMTPFEIDPHESASLLLAQFVDPSAPFPIPGGPALANLNAFESNGFAGQIRLRVHSGALRYSSDLSSLALDLTAWHSLEESSAIGQLQPLSQIDLQAVPEPSSMTLVAGFGLFVLVRKTIKNRH